MKELIYWMAGSKDPIDIGFLFFLLSPLVAYFVVSWNKSILRRRTIFLIKLALGFVISILQKAVEVLKKIVAY